MNESDKLATHYHLSQSGLEVKCETEPARQSHVQNRTDDRALIGKLVSPQKLSSDILCLALSEELKRDNNCVIDADQICHKSVPTVPSKGNEGETITFDIFYATCQT